MIHGIPKRQGLYWRVAFCYGGNCKEVKLPWKEIEESRIFYTNKELAEVYCNQNNISISNFKKQGKISRSCM